MRSYFLIITVLSIQMVQNSFAATETVLSLLGGTCWAKNYGNYNWALVSFNDRKSGLVSSGSINANMPHLITAELKKYFSSFPKSPYKAWFQCNAGGHFIFLNFYERNPSLCVMLKADGSMKWKIHSNHVFNQSSKPCFGEVPGYLMVGLKYGVDGNEARTHLEKIYTTQVERVELYEDSRFLGTFLKQSEFYKEDLFKQTLEKDPNFSRYFSYIDFDSVVTHAPWEFLKLWESEYGGF